MKTFINKMMLSLFGYHFSKYRSKKDEVFGLQKSLCIPDRRAVIFDVGAYTGESAITYNKYFNGNCAIFSFEPFKESYELLIENVKGLGNVKAYNFAVGNKNEKTTFYVNNFSATSSFLPSSKEGTELWGKELMEAKAEIQVDVQTLDTFVEEQGIDQIDILKMDVQGAEHLVLEGARKTIGQGKIKMIFAELIVIPCYDGQKDLDEQLRMYKAYGFELHNLFKSVDDQNKLRFMDGIFVYKNELS